MLQHTVIYLPYRGGCPPTDHDAVHSSSAAHSTGCPRHTRMHTFRQVLLTTPLSDSYYYNAVTNQAAKIIANIHSWEGYYRNLLA